MVLFTEFLRTSFQIKKNWLVSKEVGRPPKTIWRKIGKPKGIHKSFLVFQTMTFLRINLYLGNVIIFIFSNIPKVEPWGDDIGRYPWTPVWLAAEIPCLILPLNLTIGPSASLLNYTSVFPPALLLLSTALATMQWTLLIFYPDTWMNCFLQLASGQWERNGSPNAGLSFLTPS